MKVCTRCGQARPLINFRRFSRGKMREKPDCNVCAPPKTLAQMSEKERHRALSTTHRTSSPAFIDRLNRNAKARKAERISVKIRSHKAKTRTSNWGNAILKQARAEVKWAGACLLRYRKEVGALGLDLDLGTSVPVSDAPHPRAPYVEFFSVYTTLIRRMVGGIECDMHKTTALRPAPEQADPLHYITKAEIQTLRRLYSECLPIRGTRPAREPWFLYWRE